MNISSLMQRRRGPSFAAVLVLLAATACGDSAGVAPDAAAAENAVIQANGTGSTDNATRVAAEMHNQMSPQPSTGDAMGSAAGGMEHGQMGAGGAMGGMMDDDMPMEKDKMGSNGNAMAKPDGNMTKPMPMNGHM